MAFTPVIPVTINPTMTKGLAQSFLCPTVNAPGGTPVNLSTWTSLAAKLVPPAPNPTGANVSFGTVTGAASGVLSFATAAADFASVEPGSAKLLIVGKPTSGDDLQILASGTATLNAS